MLEPTRLDYLAAMGVVGWVPRQPLPHAAYRIAPVFPELPEEDEPLATAEVSAGVIDIAPTSAAGPARARVVVRPTKPAPAAPAPIAAVPVEPEPKPVPLDPFYLQLWVAGPCALLVEVPEPGLESASPGLRLLKDILRAVRLPQAPHLYADFRWPLNRSLQLDRSARAASLALQAFMQGRLENEPVVSIGCFGTHPRLLIGPELETENLPYDREEALEQLPPAWFAPDLDSLMKDATGKTRLWQQLKRVMSRWQGEQ